MGSVGGPRLNGGRCWPSNGGPGSRCSDWLLVVICGGPGNLIVAAVVTGVAVVEVAVVVGIGVLVLVTLEVVVISLLVCRATFSTSVAAVVDAIAPSAVVDGSDFVVAKTGFGRFSGMLSSRGW